MSGWRGFLGLGGADLTRTEWRILEVLVTAEAQKRFGTNCPTVDEMALAARDLRQRFLSEEELKVHLRALASWGRRTLRDEDRRRHMARMRRIAERCADCRHRPAPVSFYDRNVHEPVILCHECAMRRQSLDPRRTVTMEIDVELLDRAARQGGSA